MATLKENVSRMVAAGVPESEIASYIKTFDKPSFAADAVNDALGAINSPSIADAARSGRAHV